MSRTLECSTICYEGKSGLAHNEVEDCPWKAEADATVGRATHHPMS